MSMKKLLQRVYAYPRELYHYVTIGRHTGPDQIEYEAGVLMFGIASLAIVPSAVYVYISPWAVSVVLCANALLILKMVKDTRKALGPRQKT